MFGDTAAVRVNELPRVRVMLALKSARILALRQALLAVSGRYCRFESCALHTPEPTRYGLMVWAAGLLLKRRPQGTGLFRRRNSSVIVAHPWEPPVRWASSTIRAQ